MGLFTLTAEFNDGCTGWIDGWWRQCCDVHDVAYAAGADKLISDLDLAWCVATSGTEWWQIALSGGMGLVMFLGLSVFGWMFYKKRDKK